MKMRRPLPVAARTVNTSVERLYVHTTCPPTPTIDFARALQVLSRTYGQYPAPPGKSLGATTLGFHLFYILTFLGGPPNFWARPAHLAGFSNGADGNIRARR